MAEEENKLTQKYEFKSKLNLNTKSTNIAKQAEMVSADKYNQNWLNRRIQEQDLPYLPLNILQNNTYEPEEQEKSNYTNNSTINNVTSNITNYHMQANFKAIDNIKKNYLINKYIENKVFHTNITRGDIISAKNIVVADWHFKSPVNHINNENLTENQNFKQIVQSFDHNEETVNVLLESYQKLKEKVEQISNTANIDNILKNEENIEALHLAINNLSNTVLRNDVLLELSTRYKKDKKIFYKLSRIIKSNSEPTKQLSFLFDVKSNIAPKVKKGALILLLQSIKQQIETYKQTGEINREKRERIERKIKERLGLVRNKEKILEEKEQRKKLQLSVVRRVDEKEEESKQTGEINREERERIERKIEEKFVKVWDKENKILERTIKARVKMLSDTFRGKNILNITESTVVEPITKLILKKEDNINFENTLTSQKDITKYRESLGYQHIILNTAKDHFNSVIEKETNREKRERIERKIKERLGLVWNKEKILEEKELRKKLQLSVVRRVDEKEEESKQTGEINREKRERIERKIEERLGLVRNKEKILEEKELRRKLQLSVVRRVDEKEEESKQTGEINREERERIERKIEEKFVKIWDKENKILERTIKARVKMLSDTFRGKNILNITESTVVEPITKLILKKEDNINFENTLTSQKDITKYRESLGYQHIILNTAKDHFNNVIEKEIFLVAQRDKKVKTRTYNRNINEVFISHKNDNATENLETILKKVFEQMPLNNRQQITLSEDMAEKTKYNNINTQSLQKGQDKQMGRYELNNIITQKIDDNIPEIADKVYEAIDNKLKTERYRMGLF